MSFLDEIIDNKYGHERQCSEMTRRRLDYLISIALIYNRVEYEVRSAVCNEEEAQSFIEDLSNQLPIMGLHSIPHQLYDQKKAIEYLVAKDDLHELRYGKKEI